MAGRRFLEPLMRVRILLPEPGSCERQLMKLNKENQLFLGCKIDSKLREGLSTAKPGDRRYFEDPNSEFLRVLTAGDERWIGKVVKGGTNVNDTEDIQRNVVSILRRVAPAVRVSPSSIKIFVISPEEDVQAEPEPANESSGGGPYIDY